MYNFLPSSVIYRNIEVNLCFILSYPLAVFHHCKYILRKSRLVADEIHLNTLFLILRLAFVKLFKILSEQIHYCGDLFLRTLPILRRKRIKSKIFNSEVACKLSYFSKGLSSLDMSFVAGQASFLCPSSVAVHNKTDMLRQHLKGR